MFIESISRFITWLNKCHTEKGLYFDMIKQLLLRTKKSNANVSISYERSLPHVDLRTLNLSKVKSINWNQCKFDKKHFRGTLPPEIM